MENDKDLKLELLENRCELGVFSKAYLDEKDIADEKGDVYEEVREKNYFKFVNTSGLTDNEIRELIEYKKLKKINTIKNCLVFFVSLTVISLILSFALAFFLPLMN